MRYCGCDEACFEPKSDTELICSYGCAVDIDGEACAYCLKYDELVDKNAKDSAVRCAKLHDALKNGKVHKCPKCGHVYLED